MTGGTILAIGLSLLKTGAIKCIRVRRSQDNAETDIGFVGIHLDIAALEEFVGEGNDGYVVTLYDQDGGTDVINNIVGRQHQIVSNGTMLTNANGSPRMYWPDDSLSGYEWAATHIASDYQMFFVLNPLNITASHTVFDTQTGRLLLFSVRGNTPSDEIAYWDLVNQILSGETQTTTLQTMAFVLKAPSSGEIWKNGSSLTTGNNYTQRAIGNATKILSNYTAVQPHQGDFSMAVFMDNISPANLQILQKYAEEYNETP